MPKTSLAPTLRFALSALLIISICGCTKQSRKAGHLSKADEYFKAGEYEKAEIEYKNVRQIDGLDPQAIARLGIIFLDQGRLAMGHSYLQKALELQPDNLEVRLKLGYIALAGRKYSEAREAAAFVLERRPNDPDAPILLAESVLQVKDAADARARLEKLPSAQGAPVLTALGLISMRERKFKEAEAILGKALQVDPKFAPAHATLGSIYFAQKDLERAEKSLASAIEFAPSRSPIRLQFAQFNLQTGKSDAAKRILEEMIRVTPDFLPSYIFRANIATAEKEYDKSIELFEKVLSREPMHHDVLLLMAQVRQVQGDSDKALLALERARSAFPQSPQIHHQFGTIYLAQSDLEKASASFSQAITVDPKFSPAVLALAQVNIRQRNLVPAVTSLEQFIQQNPGSAEAKLLLAEAYRAQGNFDGTLSLYRSLAQASPKNGQLHLLIGTTLLQQNKRTEARQSFTQAFELSPDPMPALEQLVNLDLVEKQFAAAESRIQAHMEKNATNAALPLMLATVYRAQSNTEKEEAALQKVISLQPQAAIAHALLADIYLRTKQADKALASLQSVVAKNPKDARSHMLIGALHEERKDFAAARTSYENVLAIDPKSVAALNNLAYISSEHLGELDKALDLAQKARDLRPNQAETVDTVGWILYKKQQYARAIALLEESAAKIPENAEAVFHVGMARYMMGNGEGARAALQKALKLNSTFNGAEEAKEALNLLSLDDKSGEAARPIFEKALTRRNDDPIALLGLAALHEREGNVDKALTAYETALKANPGNTNAAVHAIRLYRSRKESAKALELARSARRIAPGDGRIAHALGRLTFESGERASSVAILKDAARQLERNADVLFDLGEASYSIGQVEAAETAFKDALAANPAFSRAAKAREYVEFIGLSQDPSKATSTASRVEDALKLDNANVPALMAKAALDQQKGDIRAAKQCYEKALARYPDFTPAKRNLAILYSSHPEDDKKALELAAKAREAYPNDADVAKALGIILFREKNFTRAAALLQESARTRTTDAEVMYYLGIAQRQLKDQSGSTRSLQRALELGLPEALAGEARNALQPGKK